MKKIIIAAAIFLATPVLANDTIAELGTGGLQFVRSEAIEMVREDLYISTKQIRVDYVFANRSSKDIEALVAFPMPPLEGNPFEAPAIPDPSSDNFLDFSVTIEGVSIRPNLEQRAIALGIDVSEKLRKLNIPLMPFGRGTAKALARLKPPVLDDLLASGIIINDVFDDGNGMKSHPEAIWKLNSTFWWRMVFPANKEIKVAHRYTPSVGASTTLAFYDYGYGKDQDALKLYREKYCMDEAFLRAVERHQKVLKDNMYENYISYILSTGSNWLGPIGSFNLSIDKGRTNNLVSFCGSNVRKTGPTVFEMTIKDFYPQGELDILLLQSSL
ncbi:hypothetical protein MNBD_ALPHA12-344 [hydrothermal vent metagenome]|uniref:DUF4424 domain-containing protein n=1 Tax=hydrothermal vent metagenome TaxID=652676 RepID=A0A3B0TH86_9ZZZZ